MPTLLVALQIALRFPTVLQVHVEHALEPLLFPYLPVGAAQSAKVGRARFPSLQKKLDFVSSSEGGGADESIERPLLTDNTILRCDVGVKTLIEHPRDSCAGGFTFWTSLVSQ